MDAFHVYWSKPGIIKNYGEIRFPDYEILTMMLSALKWREKNGSIKMITDSQGARFFDSNGLCGLWDDIDTSLDHIESDIDPFLFWAAGKLYGLKSMPCPCVMLDTDLIIWENMDGLYDCDIAGAHYEELMPDVYPDVDVFKMKDSYQFPKEWDFHIRAVNTAFLYIRDNAFRDYYVESARSFMCGSTGQGLNPTTAMCFAEQRILGMCADAKGLPVRYLLELEHANRQDFVTHIWGYKRNLERSYKRKREFCERCIRRIIADYPEYEPVIANNRRFLGYMRSR